MKRRYVPKKTLTPNQARRKHVGWIEAMAGREIPELRTGLKAAPAPRTKPNARLEAPVLAEIIKVLKMHPLVEEVWRQQAGQIPVNGGFIRLGSKGKLDVAGRLKDGRYFEIEAKAPGKKPEPHQQERIEYIRATGGVSGWATSAEEAVAIIQGG
jgi:hypothetical protein